MAEVLDLRQFRYAQLAALLAAESAEWGQLLDWDYAGSADLIRQYVEARVLPGYVLVERVRGRSVPHGYGFFIYEAHKGLVGGVFVHPDHRGQAHEPERLLLDHILATLQATPGVERIEAQLMPFAPEVLAANFEAHGFVPFRRVFLQLDLSRPLPYAAPVTLYGAALEPWGSAGFEEAAHLIQNAYHDHVDARINDQYRSFSGAVRFMHNVAHFPGCGNFDPASSAIARSLPQHRLEGMVLVSRVRPDVAHITQICVLPQRQGQHLGRALLTRCLQSLHQEGLRSVTLTVTAENQPARALYERLGFRPWSEFNAYVWERPHSASSSPLAAD